MCGLTGFFITEANQNNKSLDIVSRMAQAISHRGPDDSGAWVNEESGIALGHQRLSIIDLSLDGGHQPMFSPSRRFVMVFNGEIYNHLALRAELSGIAWNGFSDTETLLAGFDIWGIEETLKKTVGMFAIALWDTHSRTLYLARDRFGEKPLYYGWVGSGESPVFAFGSELKALKTYPGFSNQVSRESLTQYLRFMYVPAPRSIYHGIYKLEPGCLLTVRGTPPDVAPVQVLRPGDVFQTLSISRWWSFVETVQQSALNQITNEDEAIEALDRTLSEAVRLQTIADVPVGAFLSGGVDSSLIVALMQRDSSRPVNTFTIGYEESAFDESKYAHEVAKHLGTIHNELFVTSKDAQQVIPLLPEMYDEPFADSSQIPTYLVSKLARQQITVALTGDAADELFAGYNRYFWGSTIWQYLSKLPYKLRYVLGQSIESMPASGWDSASSLFNLLLPTKGRINHFGDKAQRLAERLKFVRDRNELYLSLVSEWKDPAQVVNFNDAAINEPTSQIDDAKPVLGINEDPLHMMYFDTLTYLSDDILCKVDRAAMAVNLETRVPFLDHRVVELAWRMPLSMKIRGKESKWVLRQLLYKYVPRELIERPKAGFGIPVGDWLRGTLRPWAEALLNEKRLAKEGYFHPGPIRQHWKEHLNGHRDHTHSLWSILMFQAWLEKN